MRKTILIAGVIAFFSTVSVAQTYNDTILQLQSRIVNLENRNSRLSSQVNTANLSIRKLERSLLSTDDSVAVLKNELVLTNDNLKAMSANFESQLRQLTDKSDSEFLALSKRVSNNSLYWILAMLFLTIIAAIIFIQLRRKLISLKTELSDQIKNSSELIREDILKLDNQVFWSLDFQKKLVNTEQSDAENVDHSLILKVADEIIRIQKNLSSMDPETKGLKQLEFAIDRIQDDFKENGYEIVELLNKPYDKEMKVSAKFKPDDNLKQGEQIITRIIKPQVNYNDVIIQEAQVEVSLGEK